MENKEHRRKSKRHPIRWKAAVVFHTANGKPVLHTEAQDLSVGGAAIHSNYSDLTGSMVTLLLAPPVRQSGEAPKMLKISARVVSSVQSPPMSGFRHGLSFEQSDDGALDALAEILGGAESARPGGEAIPAVHTAATPAARAALSAPEGGSRLDKLRQLALVKRLEEKKPESHEEIIARVSGALKRAYRFLNEFTEHLNVAKPAYAKRYAIVGVPNFDDLAWENGRIVYRSREDLLGITVYERVSLRFRLSANKELRVTRESPMDEKLKQSLLDTRIEFTTQSERNERGSIVRTTFVIPCEVKGSLELIGNFDTGKLLLRCYNIEHFGRLEHVLATEAITEESLDDLTGFILGESSHIGPLLLKHA